MNEAAVNLAVERSPKELYRAGDFIGKRKQEQRSRQKGRSVIASLLSL